MTKHTPGPWIYYADLPSTEPNWHIVTTENKLRVLANVHIEPGNPMDEANARLIAAAPELLAELKRVTDHLSTWAADHSLESTCETWAALHCARAIVTKIERSYARGDAQYSTMRDGRA